MAIEMTRCQYVHTKTASDVYDMYTRTHVCIYSLMCMQVDIWSLGIMYTRHVDK